MTPRPSVIVLVLTVALSCAACRVDPSSSEAPAARPALKAGSLEGAMADLQSSAEWAAPRCRWLETGPWILAYPQETALYEAAHHLGYVELERVGTANRIGTPEAAWKVTLTEAGKAQAAKCGSGSANPNIWGLPVSERRFITGTRVKEPDMYNPDRTVF